MFVYKANKIYIIMLGIHSSIHKPSTMQPATDNHMRVSYSALLIHLVRDSDDLHHVYSEAVVTTGIHAVCFLYVKGAADNVIWSPDVVLNDWLARLTVTNPCTTSRAYSVLVYTS